MKFYICKHCGNIIGKVVDKGVSVSCCGEKMAELVPNTTEAATEKHIPVATVNGDVIDVQVGSTLHPMLDNHYIEWIYIETEHGGQKKNLKPGDEPKVSFALAGGDRAKAVYAYCNLHGLWKADL